MTNPEGQATGVEGTMAWRPSKHLDFKSGCAAPIPVGSSHVMRAPRLSMSRFGAMARDVSGWKSMTQDAHVEVASEQVTGVDVMAFDRGGQVTLEEAQTPVLDLTGRDTVEDALDWIAQGWAVKLHVPMQQVLRAISRLECDDGSKARALQCVAREAATPDFDSASVLFGLDLVTPPHRFRVALDELASRSPTKSLDGLTASSVIAARRHDPFVLETLCALAGMSFRDLCERVDGLPPSVESDWSPAQVRAAFDAIDAVVRQTVNESTSGPVPLRPIDLMPRFRGEGLAGWALVEQQRVGGVPYEVLLAQRSVGGSWSAHRNRTASRVSESAASDLAERLDAMDVQYLRSRDVGGANPAGRLAELAGSTRQVGMLILRSPGRPCFGVVFASARDGGTARKSIASLAQMELGDRAQMAVLLTGPGWRQRNETAVLAEVFDGRIYTDQSLDELVADIAAAIEDSPEGGLHASDV